MPVTLIQKFLSLESASSIILLLMAIMAMIWANSPLAYLHLRFIDASLFWVNEGLMAVFFLLVGLELKRGFLEGQLAKPAQIALPLIGALGGMLVPALIYSWVNHGNVVTLKGWATPVATDIAFALGVLSLFGRRVPVQLKLFLLALAIFDDLGAILIIAFFYSDGLSSFFLSLSLILAMVLCLFNILSIRSLLPYLFVGALLWLCLLHSGIHPTIAGVILAFTIPGNRTNGYSALDYLEDKLHPWVAYLIMPLFALVNAGVSLHGLSWRVLLDEVVLGITLGLFVGKQVGVFSFTWLFIRLGFATMPKKTSWLALYGVTILCGIGFTMSLFLGTLAFANENTYLAEVRLGVIIGSVLSSVVGVVVLLIAFTQKRSSVVD
jgi:Na+:H+ antiporter, NhaA family